MSKIHKTAIISEKATIGLNVEIGPYTLIGDAIIGDDSIIHSHVVIADGVKIGRTVEVFPGALIGKEPKGAGALARQPRFEKQIIIGDECSIGPHAVIFYDVQIGNNTLIGDSASIREECKIGSQCILGRHATINYGTTIGNRTKIMDLAQITGNMTIGNDVFISMQVGTANDNVVRSGNTDNLQGPIIEDNVLVGIGAILLPGISLGEACTVAAGAVVTKNVDGGVLVAGCPAKFVKHLAKSD